MAKGFTDKDRGWQSILKAALALAGKAYVKVGILAGDDRGGLHEKDPDTGKASPLTVAEIAVVNEYGTEDGHTPARPAHRHAYDANREDLRRTSVDLLAKVVIDRTMAVETALNLLGLKHATNIKDTITQSDGLFVPNAPSTIAAKGSSRPLVDTARTINAISWGIVMGGVEKAHQFLDKKSVEERQKAKAEAAARRAAKR